MRRHPVLKLEFFMVVLLAGCASVPPPTESLTRASTAVNDAAQAKADDYAPLELRNAQQKLEQAQALAAQEDYDRAARLADEAAVDAELAAAKSRSAQVERAVEEVRESVRVLREETIIRQGP